MKSQTVRLRAPQRNGKIRASHLLVRLFSLFVLARFFLCTQHCIHSKKVLLCYVIYYVSFAKFTTIKLATVQYLCFDMTDMTDVAVEIACSQVMYPVCHNISIQFKLSPRSAKITLLFPT